MSLEINSVLLGGNLAQDVELKQTPTGRTVCTFALATNRTFVTNGEKTREATFVDVEVWGAVAENCGKYLHKGSPVVVMGRLKQERWETPNKEKRSRMKVVATNVQFLPSGNRTQEGPAAPDIEEANAG